MRIRHILNRYGKPRLLEDTTYASKMIGALKKIKDSDPETGEKLKGNIREKLLANLSKALDMV